MTVSSFTAAQLDELRAHGIVLFADRIIFNAQPPMSASEIAEVQRQCAGILPPALIQLWTTTAGGSLDYSLSLTMGSNQEAISWTELFYNNSEGYRDLRGWIAHELELQQQNESEIRRPGTSKLEYLPIGGFEYLDRIYVCVLPGPNYGHVVAWKQGLPPAWRHRLHEDSVGTVADDLESAFAALALDCDPLQPVDEFFSGQALLDYVETRVTDDGMSRDLADTLIAFYRLATIDWRSLLVNREIKNNPGAARAAIEHAIATNDRRVIAELSQAGVSFDRSLHGSAVPLEAALTKGSLEVVEELLVRRAKVPASILDDINAEISANLVSEFLRRGAQPSIDAAVQCVSIGATDCAQVIIDACRRRSRTVEKDFYKAHAKLLADHEDWLAKMKSGKPYGHYLGIDGLEKRVAELKSFKFPEGRSRGFLQLMWPKKDG